MILRDYQQRLIDRIRAAEAAGHRRILAVLPTGGGKTACFSYLIREAVEDRQRTLLLAPRRELVHQAASTLHRFGVLSGVIMAGEPRNVMLPSQVASVDTIRARFSRRGGVAALPHADLVVVDEAHVFDTKARQEILDRYGRILGVTATPARGDGRGLGGSWDVLVEGPDVAELIAAGHLVPIRYFSPSAPDLEGLKTRAGDYAVGQLSERVNRASLIGDVLTNWERLARDRQTVVFAVDRAHARNIWQTFHGAGYATEYVDGDTPVEERRQAFERISDGRSQVLVNVFVASYGLDIPSLSCAVLARPTRSVVLYRQTVGRVLRPAPGKVDAIVLDHAGAVAFHGRIEDPVAWSLDPGETLAERLEKSKKESRDITCENCSHVYRGRPDCPECGHVPEPASTPVAVRPAELQPMDGKHEAPRGEQMMFLGELKAYGAERGYKDGWAAYKFKERFGQWPPRNAGFPVDSEAIRPSTLRWIRSRQIAYSKASVAR